jgi:hypothetical protein
MQSKQQVRFRPDSSAPGWLDISPGAIGTVICRYRILREGADAPERLDVRFGDQQFAWGISEKEFERLPTPTTRETS